MIAVGFNLSCVPVSKDSRFSSSLLTRATRTLDKGESWKFESKRQTDKWKSEIRHFSRRTQATKANDTKATRRCTHTCAEGRAVLYRRETNINPNLPLPSTTKRKPFVGTVHVLFVFGVTGNSFNTLTPTQTQPDGWVRKSQRIDPARASPFRWLHPAMMAFRLQIYLWDFMPAGMALCRSAIIMSRVGGKGKNRIILLLGSVIDGWHASE